MDLQDYIDKGILQSNEIGNSVRLIARHHIESFNLLYSQGLQNICKYLQPLEIIPNAQLRALEEEIDSLQPGNVAAGATATTPATQHINFPFRQMKIWFESLSIGVPMKDQTELGTDHRLFPSECRISSRTYSGSLWSVVCKQIDNGEIEKQDICLGDIPIMVGSQRCHLNKLAPEEMIKMHEDAGEFGGYFILNGIEKLIRMLIVQKRNYPIGFLRPGFVNRGAGFTPIAVMMKCVREDLYSKTITLHYVNDGNVYLRLLHRKQEFLIPLIIILKALVKTTDLQVYNRIVRGYRGKSTISDRVEVMLQSKKNMGVDTQAECLKYLGANFRIVLGIMNPECSDKQAGGIFLREQICVHLSSSLDKFNLLCHMIHKLYQLSAKEINPDNLDSLINQEVLLSGHLYINILREKLEELFQGIRQKIFKDGKRGSEVAKIREMGYLKRAIELQTSIGKKLEYFLATGNLRSQTGLDLMQAKGYAIIADKINFMRFVSHFRSIHRGTYFAEMKTTSVRKLLPENWGFICPIHTPDGHPCGLLNHIAMQCRPLTHPCRKEKFANLVQLCTQFGMNPITNDLDLVYPSEYYTVMLDGRIIGYIEQGLVDGMISSLRKLKVEQNKAQLVSKYLELGFVPKSNFEPCAQTPGVYLFTNEARMVRPVRHLISDKIEWISPFEQNYLSIACLDCDIRGETTHQEFNSRMMLSILGAQIPFLEYNQSPRDIYQCQMSKQTMSIAFHNEPWRFDNKSYRLSSMQRPVVRTVDYDHFGFNEYPQGNNAIVAVLGYTGYDMEDGMIITKDVKERGFMNGTIWKVQQFEVNPNEGTKKMSRFKLLCAQNRQENGLDIDGIPKIGTEIQKDTLEFALFDTNKNEIKKVFSKDNEKARLQQVALIQNESNANDIKVMYKLRYSRTPIIGDKFSSRHGQKGVLSMLWPQIDMPFTESGITPDIIINPHAFPSRMTIGMLIESMAGKAGSLNGELQQIDSFTKYGSETVISYFGKQLLSHGYNYLGTEQMYSGISGELMSADLYMGVVYYQRLRHMVSDKVQARATGPIDILTQQPIKGRKRHGGIRVGEMERDALIAHGIAFAVNDRLMNVSDISEGLVCTKCGGILTTFKKENLNYCNACAEDSAVKVKIPFVLRYLVNELAAMKIKLQFRLVQ